MTLQMTLQIIGSVIVVLAFIWMHLETCLLDHKWVVHTSGKLRSCARCGRVQVWRYGKWMDCIERGVE